jgi:hypothetical protein
MSDTAASLVTALIEQLREELLAELRDQQRTKSWPEWMGVETAARYLDMLLERQIPRESSACSDCHVRCLGRLLGARESPLRGRLDSLTGRVSASSRRALDKMGSPPGTRLPSGDVERRLPQAGVIASVPCLVSAVDAAEHAQRCALVPADSLRSTRVSGGGRQSARERSDQRFPRLAGLP